MKMSIPEKAIKWLIMKKDSELPWATRIFRWNLVLGACLGMVLLMLYGAAFVLHNICEWFLR